MVYFFVIKKEAIRVFPTGGVRITYKTSDIY